MQEDEMPPLRLLSPYPESETPAKSPDTLQNELNCGRTTVGRPPEESLAQMGGAINEWEPTTDSFPGLIFIKTMTPHYTTLCLCTVQGLRPLWLSPRKGPISSSLILREQNMPSLRRRDGQRRLDKTQ
jgi:hypothetical protein